MAAATDTTAGAQADLPRRKPPRVSDLPLSSSKRASIDSLLHTFKKKGQFDELRKNTFAQFDHGVSSTSLVLHPRLSNTSPQAKERYPGRLNSLLRRRRNRSRPCQISRQKPSSCRPSPRRCCCSCRHIPKDRSRHRPIHKRLPSNCRKGTTRHSHIRNWPRSCKEGRGSWY